MSVEVLTNNIQKILDSIDNEQKKLEDELDKSPTKNGKKLLSFLKNYLWIKKPLKFKQALLTYGTQFGHALFVVGEEENKRRGISEAPKEQKATKGSSTQFPNINFQAAPAVVQQPGGFFGWLGQSKQAGTLKEMQRAMLEYQRELQSPITSEERVIDILNFGRDLIPEFINRTLKYCRRALIQVRLHPDESTKRFLDEDLCEHLCKMVGIVNTFCQVSLQHRKKALDKVREGLIKGMTEVIIAWQMAQAGAIGPRFPRNVTLRSE